MSLCTIIFYYFFPETPIYPNRNVTVQPIIKSSSHLIYSLEQNLAKEIRSHLNDSSESPDAPVIHTAHTLTQPVPIRGIPNAATSIHPPKKPEFSASPYSSHPSTCPSTPRSISPALSQSGEPPVFLSVLSKERCTRRLGEHTGCWGTLYSSGDDVTFYIETDNAEDVAVELEFYVEVPQEHENGSVLSLSFCINLLL